MINAIETTIKRIQKDLMFKKKKIKITHNFIINKKMLNAQIIKKNERATQLTLHRNFMNEFIKSNHKKQRKSNFIKSQSQYIKFSMRSLLR